MTTEQRLKLTLLEREMTRIAAPVGPMHGWWDPIFDIRAVLGGEQPLVEMSVEERVTDAELSLERWRYSLPYPPSP
jgi:hypothetical protein